MAGFGNKVMGMLRLNNGNEDNDMDPDYLSDDDMNQTRRSRRSRNRFDDNDEDDDDYDNRNTRKRRYEDNDDEYDDDDDRESNARPSLFGRNRQTKNAAAGNSGSQSASRSSVSMPDSLSSGDPGSEVRVFHPTNLDEARRVTDTLLNRQSAILNLEGLDIAMAQRIIDFVGGSNYAIKGHFTRISNFVFLFTPSDVDIAGDLVQESAEASQEMGANGQNGLNFG
ncbi:MAG: cell division protein SepF [Clostridiales bacterium]|jgi:cell division inhibitor SepF|nr:cell division protein SepF [Clostridiales bacterium]